MYIAVCDDQEEELELLTRMLNQWQSSQGAAVRFKTFRSAAELLDAAEKESFSLYLLDIMMPGTDGLEAAREILAAFVTEGKDSFTQSIHGFHSHNIQYSYSASSDCNLLQFLQSLQFLNKYQQTLH